MIVGFTLSTALYSLSIMGVQSCDIIDDMREDPVFLTKLGKILSILAYFPYLINLIIFRPRFYG